MKNWVRYNNTQNEGGEGYNPYNRRIQVSQVSTEPEWSKLSSKIDRLQAIMAGISTSDDRYAVKAAELAELRAAYEVAVK